MLTDYEKSTFVIAQYIQSLKYVPFVRMSDNPALLTGFFGFGNLPKLILVCLLLRTEPCSMFQNHEIINTAK